MKITIILIIIYIALIIYNRNKDKQSMDKEESIDIAELLYGIVKEEVDKLNEVKPQDTPAVCNYSGLRPVEGYKEEERENKEDIDKEMKIERGDINFMYKWIRSKSGK